jgi:hypothetical protein
MRRRLNSIRARVERKLDEWSTCPACGCGPKIYRALCVCGDGRCECNPDNR